MDTGRTEIINAALLYANQDTILSHEGESKNAKLCSQFYDSTLQEALSGHAWSFALVAAKLAVLATPPKDFRFRYAYRLPTNFGRMYFTTAADIITELEGMGTVGDLLALVGSQANSIPIPEYIIQGKELYSNAQNLQIVYSRTDVLPFEMTPQFRNYFAALLASKLFTKMNGGTDGLKDLQNRLTAAEMKARHVDSSQADTLEKNRPNLLVWARNY